MRLTIDKTHDKYLQLLASQMDATPKEIINFLLWKLRESNYTFQGQLPTYQPQVQQYFDPSTFESRPTAMSGLSFQPQSPQAIQEYEQIAEEIDPIIEKFINLGLVDQF